MNIEMRSSISEILRLNALVLFNIEGIENHLAYQRHVASKIDEIPGFDLNSKIENSIILAISLWQSWKIHATKSEYSLPWYSCAQIDEEWLLSGEGTPPYVIFDSENPNKVSIFF